MEKSKESKFKKENNSNFKKEVSDRAGILILAIVVILIAAVISVIKINNNISKENSKSNTNNTNGVSQTADNFIITEGTSKLNTSETVTADKKVGNILIQNSKIEYEQIKGSTLTAKVTNDSVAKENLRVKVTFIANDGSTVAETVALVGKVESNETKYINAGTTIDVTNAKDISYEIVE
jgi:hypothetical protein